MVFWMCFIIFILQSLTLWRNLKIRSFYLPIIINGRNHESIYLPFLIRKTTPSKKFKSIFQNWKNYYKKLLLIWFFKKIIIFWNSFRIKKIANLKKNYFFSLNKFNKIFRFSFKLKIYFFYYSAKAFKI
jgi:hypothetical protein